jgi:hypothetical protein
MPLADGRTRLELVAPATGQSALPSVQPALCGHSLSMHLRMLISDGLVSRTYRRSWKKSPQRGWNDAASILFGKALTDLRDGEKNSDRIR